MVMTRRPEFSRKTKLAAWTRAGGPDDPRCECGCGLPITKSDPAQYHHIEEAESGDNPERRAYLRSLANCLCVRASCHQRITATETMPKIVRSRRQREAEANIRAKPSRPVPGSRADWRARRYDKHEKRWVWVNRETGERL